MKELRKTQRNSGPRLLVGLGLVLAVVTVCWRHAGLVAARRVVASTGLTSRPGQFPARDANPQFGGLTSGERDVPSDMDSSEQPTTPFLKGLVAALNSIAIESDPGEKEAKLDTLSEGMALADFPTALGFLEGHESSEPNRALSLRLIRRWAGSDPWAAAEAASQMPKGPLRQEAVVGVATVWANQDLEATLDWVRKLPGEEEKDGGLIAAAYEAARTKPLEALRLAIELPASGIRNDLIVHAANQWAASEPAAAAEWTAGISDPALRERVLTVVATALGGSSPMAAATLALESMAPGKRQDDAVVGIVQRWTQTEPEQAAAWVVAFPDGALRDAALENLVTLWADRDVESAGHWLDGLEPGGSRDAAIGAYVSKITPTYPQFAARWAEDIDDALVRELQMEIVAKAWMASDAPEARAWIEQTPLDDATKARMLSFKPN